VKKVFSGWELIGAVIIVLGLVVACNAGTTNFDDLAADSITITGTSTFGATVLGATTVSGLLTLSSTVEGVVQLKPQTTAEANVIIGTTATKEGTCYYNSTSKKIQVWNATSWKTVSFEP